MATKTVSKSTCKIPKPKYTPAQFKRLSKAKQRVEVAKDVLAQLKNNAFETCHSFIQISYPENTDIGDDLRSVLLSGQTECYACQLGANWLSMIRLRDDVNIRSFSCSDFEEDVIQDNLQFWGKANARRMEEAYERGGGWVRSSFPSPATTFGHQYLKDKDRMVAIMKNVIKNNGEFKP